MGTYIKSLLHRASVILIIGAVSVQALAQSETESSEGEDDFDELLDEVEIDVQGSLDDSDDGFGFRLDGDLRLGYIFDGEDFQDVTFGETDVLRARWRIRSSWRLQQGLRVRVRVAGLCSTEDCDPEFILQPNIPTPASIEDGQVTIDSMYLEWFKRDQFDIALGRLETKFVARGGVFAKSLDRNDSNNLRVNWTDGLHSTFKAKNGWESHLIVQYNDEDGPSNVRRSPLDFSSGKSRQSYFVAFQSLEPKRRLIQRGIDVSYLPATLAVDSPGGSRHEDYWALVARAAFRWPVRSDSWRLRLSSELGYAPTTQTRQQAGIVGSGDADGLAWNVTASIMDFLPRQSIGINYARTGAGWLLSPQYADNEQLIEIRYMWRTNERLSVDVRARWRDELLPLIIEDPGRDRFDFYARLTWSFQVID